VRRYRRRKRAVHCAGDYRLGRLRQAPLLFTVVELLGAAYLLWIGSLLLQSRPSALAPDGASAHARRWQNSFCWGWVLRCSIPKTPCFIWR
jgi:threonine/homoserine/homoserine lactone efflux protein